MPLTLIQSLTYPPFYQFINLSPTKWLFYFATLSFDTQPLVWRCCNITHSHIPSYMVGCGLKAWERLGAWRNIRMNQYATKS